jgi:hypothetical protein
MLEVSSFVLLNLDDLDLIGRFSFLRCDDSSGIVTNKAERGANRFL